MLPEVSIFVRRVLTIRQTAAQKPYANYLSLSIGLGELLKPCDAEGGVALTLQVLIITTTTTTTTTNNNVDNDYDGIHDNDNDLIIFIR